MNGKLAEILESEVPWPKLDEDLLRDIRERAAREFAAECIYFRKEEFEVTLSIVQAFFELGYRKGRADALEESTV